jgi:hypothetical protein
MLHPLRTARTSSSARFDRGRSRLTLELLEDRLSPAVLTVNSTADTANPSDPYLSLREAIALINSPTLPNNLSAQILAQIQGTLHQGGADTIGFDPAAVTGPIVLAGTQLELSLPRSTAAVSIDGGTAGVTVDGNNASRVLQVDAGVQAALEHLTITHGSTSANGGGILNSGTLTVTNSTLSANSTSFSGGGVYNTGSLTVANSTLSANSATGMYGQGGGIDNGGTVTVSNSTLFANSARLYGGGLENQGTLTVTSSTLSANSAYLGGGISSTGATSSSGSTLTVTSSTFSANSAGAQGGGIFNSNSTLTVTSSTLSANSASYAGNGGGGIYIDNGSVCTLRNTLVAGNLTTGRDPDLYGTVDSGSSYNLVGIGDIGLSGISEGVNHNQIGTTASPIDPLLSPLGYYGGPTQTFALLPGSPARLAGSAAYAYATDQRGQLTQVVAGSIDIGAFQTQPDPFLVTTLTDPGRQFGLLSLREAVNLANALPGDNTVSFLYTFSSGTVTLTDGQLELSGSSGVRTIDGGNRITIDGNHASRLFLVDAGVQAVLTRLDLANGSSDSGGGVFNSGSLTLAYCTLYGNAAIYGGAVCNVATLTVYGSSFFDDFSYYQGGGVLNAGTLSAFNDTFAYDTAFSDGGAIYSLTGSVTLTSLTISLNNSASGGGLAVASGDVLLRNCIVAGNLDDTSTAASDIAGRLDASSSYNLIGTGGSGGLSDGTDHNHVGVANPGLTPPDFSTTLSPVFGFTSSSPALGAGDPTLLSDPLLRLDQHGNARSNPPNIGAV